MGTMRLCRGDVFAATSPAIAHGCNIIGAMGAGIAEDFKNYFPEMYDAYHELCKNKQARVGSFMPWQTVMNNRNIIIYNLFTQTGCKGADVQFLRDALAAMFYDCTQRGIKEVTIPMIGGGYGGIAPVVCLNCYLEAVQNWDGILYVVVQPFSGVIPEVMMDHKHDIRDQYKRAIDIAKQEEMRKALVNPEPAQM